MPVVGILGPTRTADDQAVFVDLKTAWVIQGLGHGHQDVTKLKNPTLVLKRTESNVAATAKLFHYTEIIVSHPVYDYFARRYGLNIVSVHWEPDEVPHDDQLRELKEILNQHPAKWMIWEGDPLPESVEKLKSMSVSSLVFDPCGNKPEQGDFITVMKQNIENLKKSFQ